MATTTLTEKGVERLKPHSTKRLEVWDKTLPCFGLRVTPRGAKSFVVMRRVHGRNLRRTLGTFPELTVKQARDKARAFLQELRDGFDPRLTLQPRMGFEGVLEQFLERHVYPNCSEKHARETERILRREALPRWRNWPLDTIKRAHVLELMDEIKDRGAGIQANRTLAALSRLFRFAVERGYVETSPCLMVSAPARERARETVLADDEIGAVWNAADTLTFWFRRWFRFYMATGQRLTETAELRWDELDLDKRVWTLPPERTKNGKTHSVPLSELALAQIEDLPRLGAYVFTTTAVTPISPGTAHRDTLKKVTGTAGWTFHDIRRTVATWLESAGCTEKEIALVLNHHRASVTSIYARADLMEKKREMLDAWAAHVKEASQR